ncbi:MAG: hypothetical protein PHQ43_07975 [Dehalococcoidales bacterium]|nr:hypothetical protein [Dehalococcoidales bacterium]
MRLPELVIGILLVTSVLLIVSCAEEKASPLPETSTANEAPVVVPSPTPPPDRFGMSGAIPPTGRENVYSVQIDLVPSKLVYVPGEQFQMELVLANASQGEVEPVILNQLPPIVNLTKAGVFSGPAVPPGLALPDTESGESMPVKTFPAGTGQETLAKGDAITYSLTWDQKDEDGNQVPSGWYYYESNYCYRPESSENSVGSGVRKKAFLIQYPQGAMQKTIEVNQSQTVANLPITTLNSETKLVDVVINLQRVELNEMGATFYATMTSPNNPVSGYNNPEWLSHVPLSAQYVVDGVTKEARAPNSQFLDSGIEFRWGASPDDDNYLDPVPVDAKQLTFVIPEIRPDWEGPWEFEIQLE